MSGHRMSKKRRYIAWAVAAAAVLVGGGVAAEASMATTVSRPAPKVYTGRAFDTCAAPSASAMKAWHTGFYGAAAVYVGGRNRGCAQPNLTASWVKSVSATGWKLIPLYVGAQPPCQTSRNPEKLTASTAASLGATDGADAVAKASALGMKAGSPVYLDMESYDVANTSCNNAVLTYIRAWDKAVHAKGYWAGFYGFRSSSAKAVATATNRTDLPDILWYALWDGHKTTTTDWPFSTSLWTGHRRGHQYMVNSKESRGGYAITVDRSYWDAPVAVTG
ncbi:glycoside hydrolase domain-containing protein [Actinacidiphila sp. bgisy160]|uniref:glycoside hydrolase domain-containing protein n=1 Tax=Actinacidiphila sp. bgisy160 TaxID=3413796 RepID=UPI003D72C292